MPHVHVCPCKNVSKKGSSLLPDVSSDPVVAWFSGTVVVFQGSNVQYNWFSFWFLIVLHQLNWYLFVNYFGLKKLFHFIGLDSINLESMVPVSKQSELFVAWKCPCSYLSWEASTLSSPLAVSSPLAEWLAGWGWCLLAGLRCLWPLWLPQILSGKWKVAGWGSRHRSTLGLQQLPVKIIAYIQIIAFLGFIWNSSLTPYILLSHLLLLHD